MFGPPGAGKGTQAERLGRRLLIPTISTGDLLRKEIRNQTEVGLLLKKLMDSGKLIKDSVVTSLMSDRLEDRDASRGAIFDGFPRKVSQIDILDSLLEEKNRKLLRVIALEVPTEVILQRTTGRRVDPTTGKTYHTDDDPPPEGVKVVQRSDDTEEVVLDRIETYYNETEPVLEVYSERGLVSKVDGVGPIDVVERRILRALGLEKWAK